MKTLLRRVFFCWLRDSHWTSTVHGYYPAQWANCSCCGRLLFAPHQIAPIQNGKTDLVPPPEGALQ